MAGRNTGSGATETAIAAGGVALLASILGNLKLHGDKQHLAHSVEALQGLVQDWQIAYRELDAQLALALRSNQELNRLVTSLREEGRKLRDRAHMSEKRALDTETALAKAQKEIARLKAGTDTQTRPKSPAEDAGE